MEKKNYLNSLKNNDVFYCFFLIFFIGFVVEVSLIAIDKLNFNKKNLTKVDSKYKNFSDVNKKISIYFPRTITSMKENIKQEKISFRTDSIGSIYPSSFANINQNTNYGFFCGGSTLEASQVKEGLRPSDVFSKESKLRAINVSKANQSLDGCITKIDQFNIYLKESGKAYKNPDFYVIATNHNTLSDFTRSKYIKKQNQKINKYELKSIAEINKFLKKMKRDIFFKTKISEYEHAIIDGCCYPPSEINSKNNLRLDWEDPRIKDNYFQFLSQINLKLDQIKAKHNIPNQKIIFLLEPNSFSIKNNSFNREYFGKYDTRQRLHNYEGNELTNLKSGEIINGFDYIYSDFFRKNSYKVITPNGQDFPSFSFYDAAHYTDKGAKYLGNFLYEEIYK